MTGNALSTWFRVFRLILRAQLFVVRTSWLAYLLMMTLQPITLLLLLYFLFASEAPETIFYIISGNMVMALSLNSMLALGQELGWMKAENALDYYATLPIPKSALIFAIVTRSIVISFIPIMIIFLLASLLFGVSIAPSPLFLLAVAISGYSMAGVGAIIGFYSPDGRTSSLLTQIVQPIIVFLSPVFVPFEQLPAIFQWTSHFIPTTYVAKAIRDTLANQITGSTWASILVVFGITIATLLFIEKGLDWRGGE